MSSVGPLRAAIDLGALARNFRRLRRLAGRQRVLAVVKGNAYGHGLEHCARVLESADPGPDGLGVARVHEAVRLRASGAAGRVVVLGGCASREELETCADHALEPVVHDAEHVRWLEHAPRGLRVRLWLKVDSGMHRMGFAPGALAEVHRRLMRCPAVLGPPVLVTHLANADVLDDSSTSAQRRCFEAAVEGLPGERSIANSAGLLGWPETASGWARPGLALYGISPFADRTGAELGLEPVMSLSTRLIAVKTIERGARVGYGGTWSAPEPMTIGIAAVGYADGYPRAVPAGTPVLVDGERAASIGRVSMDTMTLDLRRIARPRVGSPVTLWGAELPVEEVAFHIGRIPYELVAGLGPRVAYAAREES